MYSLKNTCDSEGSMMAVKMNLLCSSQKDGAVCVKQCLFMCQNLP
jgi:hypothetical protein